MKFGKTLKALRDFIKFQALAELEELDELKNRIQITAAI